MNKFLISTLFCIILYSSAAAQVSFDTDVFQLQAGEYGNFIISTPKDTNTLDHFNRISPLVTGNDFQVFDAFNDALVVDSVAFIKDTIGKYEYRVIGTYDTSFSGLPPAFLIQETIYGWDDQPYLVVKLNVKNVDQVQLSSIIGLDIEASIDGTFERDTIRFDSENQILYLYDTTYFGIRMINADVHTAYTFPFYDSYMLSDTSYFNWLTGGIKDSAIYGTGEDGGVAIFGTTPFNLNPNDSAEVFFGIAFGPDEETMIANLDSTLNKFLLITSVSPEATPPQAFSLSQNYPNPFNPSTKITFNLPAREAVKLKVFNILGQEVALLVNNELDAGSHTINFNAANLPSGVYIYQITTGSFSSSKKMTLLK